MSRGNALVEALLESGIPYTSGPEWLSRHVLASRWTLAVAGTHGKTTTSSILAWILEYAGLDPGFLIGGVPGNFNVTARLGGGQHFVVEADEYDTAFFDKRAKFVHYRPRTAVLNNLEHDHADIYPDVAVDPVAVPPAAAHGAAQRPGRRQRRRRERHARDRHGLLDAGGAIRRHRQRRHRVVRGRAAGRRLFQRSRSWKAIAAIGEVQWSMLGRHNAENALAAMLAARHAGVAIETAVAALKEFRACAGAWKCAASSTALRSTTISHIIRPRSRPRSTACAGASAAARLIAVLEPRSNTMKLGTHRDALAKSLAHADRVWMYQGPNVTLGRRRLGRGARRARRRVEGPRPAGRRRSARRSAAGDHVLIMSNGGFGGIHGKLLERLASRAVSSPAMRSDDPTRPFRCSR